MAGLDTAKLGYGVLTFYPTHLIPGFEILAPGYSGGVASLPRDVEPYGTWATLTSADCEGKSVLGIVCH